MRGAILCEVNDSEAGRDALDLPPSWVTGSACASRPSTASRSALSNARPSATRRHFSVSRGGGDDVIVVGSRPGGRLRRGLESKLARRLETETPVPVLIAPPRTPRARQAAA